MRALRLVAAAAFVAAVFACSSRSTPPTPDYAGTCRTLGSRCHGIKNNPLADECHNLGHDGDDSKCGPRFDECIAVCPEKEAGAPNPHESDAGATDAAADAGDAEAAASPDRCTLFCECMIPTCSMKTGYPWGSGQEACVTGCRALGTEALDCQIPWCDQAKADGAGAASDHSCGHAWGHECH